MPRDLPTRRVFLSRSHFVSFIPLSTTTCGLRPRSGRSGDALPRCFLRWALPRCSCPTPFADVWDIQHVPCLAPFVVRVETLAFIRNKKIIINRQWYYFFCEPISSDTIPHGFLAPWYRKEYFCSPTCGTSTILVHLPCTQNSKGVTQVVALQ